MGKLSNSLLVCHFHEGQIKICTYNNINKWHNKQHWNTHILLCTITVSTTDRINLPLYHTTLCLLSKVFTHYFKEAMFSHWTMSVCSRWQYKLHSNEDNYILPYQNMGITRLYVYLRNCLSSTFSSSKDAHAGNCDIYMSPNDYKYKSGTIKKSCENQSNGQDVSNFVCWSFNGTPLVHL